MGGAILAALCLLPPARAAAQGRTPSTPAHEIAMILERARLLPGKGRASTAENPARLGPEAIPALLDALAGIPPATADGRSREALLSALEHLPVSGIRSCIERGAEAAPDEARRGMLEALGRCGLAQDLELMIRVATAASSLSDEDPVPRALEDAVRRLLERDAAGYALLETLVRGAPDSLRSPLLRAAATVASGRGVILLARIAEKNPELGPLALAHLSRAGARARRPADEEVLSVVRRLMVDAQSPVLPEATLAAGCLDDSRAIPRLIELLADPRPGVSGNALWSLRAISGLDLRGSAERWRAWHEAEETWRRETLPEVVLDLRSGEKARIANALVAIAGRRWYRHELALAAAPVLEHPDPEIRILACDALGQLRSTAVIEPLLACLGSPEGRLRAAARAALRSITGEDHPPDAGAWRRALGRR